MGRDRAARRYVSWLQTFSLAINNFIFVSLHKQRTKKSYDNYTLYVKQSVVSFVYIVRN